MASATGVKPIGTLVLHIPIAFLAGAAFGSTSDTGSVYLVHSPNPKTLVPEMLLHLDNSSGTPSGDDLLGKLSSAVFPMTVTFGLPYNINTEPASQLTLPMSSLTVSFPARISPFIIGSCTKVPAARAQVADSMAPFAPDFGDFSDGYSQTTYRTPALPVKATKPVVTDHCK